MREKAEWRFALMRYGAPFVIEAGTVNDADVVCKHLGFSSLGWQLDKCNAYLYHL